MDLLQSTDLGITSTNRAKGISFGRAATHGGGDPTPTTALSRTKAAIDSTVSGASGSLPARHPAAGGSAGTTP
jgi:hypothetical protein